MCGIYKKYSGVLYHGYNDFPGFLWYGYHSDEENRTRIVRKGKSNDYSDVLVTS